MYRSLRTYMCKATSRPGSQDHNGKPLPEPLLAWQPNLKEQRKDETTFGDNRGNQNHTIKVHTWPQALSDSAKGVHLMRGSFPTFKSPQSAAEITSIQGSRPRWMPRQPKGLRQTAHPERKDSNHGPNAEPQERRFHGRRAGAPARACSAANSTE